MLQSSKTKWQINQELVKHCSDLLNHSTNKINGYNVLESFYLDKERELKVNVLEGKKFNLENAGETIEGKSLLKLANKLRPHLQDELSDFYKKYDSLKDSDSKVALSAKGQKLIYQIAFNLDKIPELKSEIINIGKLLEKDKDIYDHYGF